MIIFMKLQSFQAVNHIYIESTFIIQCNKKYRANPGGGLVAPDRCDSDRRDRYDTDGGYCRPAGQGDGDGDDGFYHNITSFLCNPASGKWYGMNRV